MSGDADLSLGSPNDQGHQNELVKSLIERLDAICAEIFERWDKDQRSGKLLKALGGRLPGYRGDVEAIRQALASLDGYPHQPGSPLFEGGAAYEAHCDAQERAHPAFLRQRGPEDDPFECPDPITCQFPRCDCEAPPLTNHKPSNK